MRNARICCSATRLELVRARPGPARGYFYRSVTCCHLPYRGHEQKKIRREAPVGSSRGASLNISRCLGGESTPRPYTASTKRVPRKINSQHRSPPHIMHNILAFTVQDILSRLSFLARINHPLIAPRTCIALTTAIRLQYNCAIFDPPPTPHVDAIHHTIVCMAISCKG